MKEEKKISFTTFVIAVIIAVLIIGVFLFAIVNNARKNDSTGTLSTNYGEELSVDSELVTKLRAKFDFGLMTVMQNIYENEGKNSDTFSNEFKLLLGWNNIASKVDYDDERVTNLGKDNAKFTVSQKEMEESIKSIFGSNVKYTDETFDNTENKLFWQSRTTNGTVSYSNGVYTSKFVEGGGSAYPYISEYVTKAVKYSDRVEIYVLTAFCKYNDEADEDREGAEISIYSDLNMKDLVDNYDGTIEGADTEEKFEKAFVEKYQNKLDTYKYTFMLDNKTGEYYFAGIEL